MKKVITAFLALVMVLSLCACGSSGGDSDISNQPMKPTEGNMKQYIVNE